jgi:hypothetical protein
VAETNAIQEEPNVGGVRMRPSLTLLLYALLVLSALVALWAQRSPADVPVIIARSAPWVFLVFMLGFAVYRFALVAAKRYSAFKAFFQVAVAAVFFLLLLPNGPVAVPGLNAPVPAARQDLAALLGDPDPRVRALAAELARYRPQGQQVAHMLALALKDSDPDVRQVAHETLVQFNSGQDLGLTPEAWEKRFP